MLRTRQNAESRWQKFEGGIVLRDWLERLRRRTGGHRKKRLDLPLEVVEISFQNFRLLRVGDRAKAKLCALASLLQRDFSGGLGVAYPLRASPRGDEIALAVLFQKIDGGGKEFAGFTSVDLEQVVVGETHAESDQESEDAVEEFFEGRGFAEGGGGFRHAAIIGLAWVVEIGKAPVSRAKSARETGHPPLSSAQVCFTKRRLAEFMQ